MRKDGLNIMKSYSRQCLVSAGNDIQEKRILIIDDDDDEKLLNLLSSMITMMGFEVDTAGSGDEAINQFMKKPFDIVLTDLNMPGMDGWSLARYIKDLSPETPGGGVYFRVEYFPTDTLKTRGCLQIYEAYYRTFGRAYCCAKFRNYELDRK